MIRRNVKSVYPPLSDDWIGFTVPSLNVEDTGRLRRNVNVCGMQVLFLTKIICILYRHYFKAPKLQSNHDPLVR